MKKLNQSGVMHHLAILAVVVIAVVGGVGWKVYKSSQHTKNNSAQSTPATKNAKDKTETKSGDKSLEPVKASSKNPTAVSTKPKAPATTPKPAPAVSTNCQANGPGQYDVYAGVNNVTFLKTNDYSGASKMAEAIKFAGLESVANGQKTVVFASNDYVFSKLTKAQTDFMYASPANMKSVIGWQIVQSCVTYSGGMSNQKTNTTIHTVNGPITWTAQGHGFLGNAEMAIWDWYTSNGAVHFLTDFAKPPAQ
jgi:hypothetical protein